MDTLLCPSGHALPSNEVDDGQRRQRVHRGGVYRFVVLLLLASLAKGMLVTLGCLVFLDLSAATA